MSRHPVINNPPQGRTVAVVGDVYRFLATGDDTSGKYALFEALVGPGGGPPPHVHSREEEGFYVLEGEITFTVNGERVVATAGTFANMPVGTPQFQERKRQTGEDVEVGLRLMNEMRQAVKGAKIPTTGTARGAPATSSTF